MKSAGSQACSSSHPSGADTPAAPVVPAGTYPIVVTQGSLSAANYTFSFVDGTLTVSAAGTPPIALTTTWLIPSDQDHQ